MNQGARIINMNFAGPKDPSLERALKLAHDRGIVLIAAAGNAGPKSPPLFPILGLPTRSLAKMMCACRPAWLMTCCGDKIERAADGGCGGAAIDGDVDT